MTVRAITQGMPAGVAISMFGSGMTLDKPDMQLMDNLGDDVLFFIMGQMKYRDLINLFKSQLIQQGGVHGDGRNLTKYASPNGEEDPEGEWFAPPSPFGIRGRWVQHLKTFSAQDLARDLRVSQRETLDKRVKLYILLVLGWCSQLEVLDLHDVDLDPDTVYLLTQIRTTTLKNLKTLNLEDNFVYDRYSSDLLAKTVNLQNLMLKCLSGLGTEGDEEALSLMKNLAKLTELKVLHLTRTRGRLIVAEEMILEFGRSMHNLSKLEELNLKWKDSFRAPELNYLLPLFPPSMCILCLSGVDDQSLCLDEERRDTINLDVENGVNLPALHSLLLDSCTLEVKNLQKMIGLCGNRLKKLEVRNTNITIVKETGNGVRMSSPGLEWTNIVQSISSSQRVIQEVEFTRLMMSDGQGKILLDLLRTCPNIRNINLSHNNLGALSVGVLGMDDFPKIQKLNLSCNTQMGMAKEKLVQIISKKYASCLTYLRLDDIGLDDECVMRLARNPFPNLEELSLWKCGSLSREGLITLLKSLGKGLLHLRLGILNKRYDATPVHPGVDQKVMKNLNLSNIFQDTDGQNWSTQQRLPTGLLTMMLSGFSMDGDMVGFAQRLPRTLKDLRICNSIVILPVMVSVMRPVKFSAGATATRIYREFLQVLPKGLREFHITPAGYFLPPTVHPNGIIDFQTWTDSYYLPPEIDPGMGRLFLEAFEGSILHSWLEMGRNVEVMITRPHSVFS